jgi:PRTRC genetic system protein A
MIVSHVFAKTDLLEPMPLVDLYQYVVAANGIFVRAERPGLHVLIWVAATSTPIRGLVELSPYVHTSWGKVPARITAHMIEMAYRASHREILHERLFYLEDSPWRLILPEQSATGVSVRPLNPYGAAAASIEVHSHHAMAPYFSSTDDRDERGFRIYAVLGNLLSQPMIHVRVSVYWHFCSIPACRVFELPVGVEDAYLASVARSAHGD